ncbi:MAG TPA: trypsin-like peptidase domain-containing protein [Chloroflexota bacterium]
MNSKSGIGAGSLILVAIVALIFGAIGGAIVGSQATKTKVVQAAPPDTAPSSNPIGSSVASTTPLSWVEVARRAGPAVVTIVNRQQQQTDIFGNVQPGATAEGSGFVIDRKGDIVTNNHVVEGAQSLTVVFSNGRKSTAQLVRADPLSDLAVVRVSVPVTTTLSFGNSNALQPGEPVLAIGSALGEYRNTVTSGIVSALGRTITEPENGDVLQNMVQTDAPINQGNSGGPLLNDLGQVIGVNTAITRGAQSSDIFGLGQSGAVAEGLGFAIPSSTVRNVAARLVENKPPAFLGVTYHQISQQDSTFYGLPVGAYINSVKAGSPAAKAGLKVRDVVTKVDSRSLSDTYQLEQVIAEHEPGQVTTLSVWRNGKSLTIKVKLSAKP